MRWDIPAQTGRQKRKGKVLLFPPCLLFRPPTDCTMPTHTRESSLLGPSTDSNANLIWKHTHRHIQISEHPLIQSSWHGKWTITPSLLVFLKLRYHWHKINIQHTHIIYIQLNTYILKAQFNEFWQKYTCVIGISVYTQDFFFFTPETVSCHWPI